MDWNAKDNVDAISAFENSLIPALKDTGTDYSELALDSVLDDGVLKEIPVIKSLLAIWGIGKGIREYFTVKKIYKFLYQLKDVPEKDKVAFIGTLDTDRTVKKHILEKLLFILDRYDDVEKAEITGNLFKAAVKGHLNIDIFFKLCSIVDACYIMDIKSFCYNSNRKNVSPNVVEPYVEYFERMDVRKTLASYGIYKESIESDEAQQIYERRMMHGSITTPIVGKYTFAYQISPSGFLLRMYGYPELFRDDSQEPVK